MKERGFVNAGKLLIGDPLLDVHGNILVVENTRIEYLDEPETVYNFQVEDFHTYYVGTKCIFVHNANCKLIDNGDDTYDVELSYKKDWTTEQRFEADMKCKALSEADTYKTMPNRRWSASSRYKAAYGEDSVLPTQDVDHIIDLQLAGKDVITNMSPLDMSVNRSLGRQSAHVIKDLEPNTVLKNFRMK